MKNWLKYALALSLSLGVITPAQSSNLTETAQTVIDNRRTIYGAGALLYAGYAYNNGITLGDIAADAWKHKWKHCIKGLSTSLYFRLYESARKDPAVYWDWDSINPEQVHFPQNFLWGVATSAHQVEGGCNDTWTRWEKTKRTPELSGQACEQWSRYKEDVQLIKNLGVKAYRFSIAWDKVEPAEGQFNEAAIQHYKNLCTELIQNGIKPCITLHHYTDPVWFADKDGFEKEENIQYYVRFAQKMFEALHQDVHLWFTFNSPSGYAAKGYLTGDAPPGKKDMQLMSEVYKNILEAHVQTYNTLKQINPASQIGILKNILQLDPSYVLSPTDLLACYMGKKLIDDCFFNFFSTGTFSTYIPFKVSVTHTNTDAPQALDFIGINYYSHTYMQNFSRVNHPDETVTNNPNYTVYPEGIYRAVKEVAQKIAEPLNIPMYITENGIATTDDNLRTEFCKKYLYALSQAIADGYDVRGYIHWSLMDNYEWGTYNKKYGLYHVDFVTQQRTLKDGAQYFVQLANA